MTKKVGSKQPWKLWLSTTLAVAAVLVALTGLVAGERPSDVMPLTSLMPVPTVEILETHLQDFLVVDEKELTPLQKAFRSTVRIYWYTPENGVTTGTVTGRQPLEDDSLKGWYRYFIITAAHGISDVDPGTWTIGADVFQMPSDEDEPVLVAEEVDVLVHLPVIDLMVIAFDSNEHVSVLQLPAEDHLSDLTVGNEIYGIGCDNAGMPLTRLGVLSLKRYNHPRNLASKSHFHLMPTAYMTLGMDVWSGGSGGGIYDEHGNYIGMILAIGVNHWGEKIPHVSYGLKYSIIKQWLQDANAEYVFENKE